jgi:hypothetical protein
MPSLKKLFWTVLILPVCLYENSGKRLLHELIHFLLYNMVTKSPMISTHYECHVTYYELAAAAQTETMTSFLTSSNS